MATVNERVVPTAAPAQSPSYRHILVPLDGSALAAGAIPTALALAGRFGADVHTISVVPSEAEAVAFADHVAEVAGTDGHEIEVHVQAGDDAAGGIRRQAAALGSCLVCMSTHGRGRVSEALTGSVARSVLATTPEPIVAVGPPCALAGPDVRAPLSAGDLVACVDGGAPSELVLPLAAAWAGRLGIGLTIVTVAEPSPPPLRAEDTWHRHHGPQTDVEKYLHRLADEWAATAPSVRTEAIYDPISAAAGIGVFLEAHAAGLLAVTTHAREGASALVLGSGAASIIHASSVPVLVVPRRAGR